jgi:transcriptional regulator with XRE-family HTH domain
MSHGPSELTSDSDIAATTGSFHVDLLRRELVIRRRRRPRYSLRAFAYQLKLDPSALSRILIGKQPLTPRAAARVLQALDLSDSDAIKFKASVIADFQSRTLRPFQDADVPTEKALPDPVRGDYVRTFSIDEHSMKDVLHLIETFGHTLELLFGAREPGSAFNLVFKASTEPATEANEISSAEHSK